MKPFQFEWASVGACGARLWVHRRLSRRRGDGWRGVRHQPRNAFRGGQVMGTAGGYDSYEAMLDKAKLDAVILGTPMACHAPQAIAAWSAGSACSAR